MATITVPGGNSSVAGQLVPIGTDGSQLPITSIQAGSEAYTTSDPTIATVVPIDGQEGGFTVTRVPNASGAVTVSYTANNTEGTSISGSDSFVFEAPVILAASLTATYGTPV